MNETGMCRSDEGNAKRESAGYNKIRNYRGGGRREGGTPPARCRTDLDELGITKMRAHSRRQKR